MTLEIFIIICLVVIPAGITFEVSRRFWKSMNAMGIYVRPKTGRQDGEKTIRGAIAIFEAERMGAEEDVPEGERYILCSDTLAKQMTERLRELLPKAE